MPESPSPENSVPMSRDVRGSFPRVVRLSRKELRETLRDRRTIGTLILMPLILYPILSMAFQRFLVTSFQAGGHATYRVGAASADDLLAIQRLYEEGDALITAQEQRDAVHSDEPAADTPLESSETKIEWYVADDLLGQIASMQIDLGIVAPHRASESRDSSTESEPAIRFLYRQNSVVSLRALLMVEERVRVAGDAAMAAWQQRSRRAPPLLTIGHQVVTPIDTGGVSLASLVPLILVLTTITGAVYPAIDLTAGERERGTLETLIAAPVPRLGLLTAKYVAVVTVAMLTATVNLVAMTITLKAAGLSKLLFGPDGLPISSIIAVFLLLMLFAGFFSAVLLALTSFARSFKEAQAYLIPLMLLALAPGVISLMPSIHLRGPLMVVPLLNIVLLSRDIFAGTAEMTSAFVAILSTIFYSLAAIALAARIFGTDAILYGTQQSWADWLLRHDSPRSVAKVGSALACLALLFPAYIVVAGLLGQWKPVAPAAKLLASGAATMLLFGGLPVWMMWQGRIRMASGIALRRTSLASCLAAIVLGLSSWVLAHEIIVLREQWGSDVVSRQQEQIEAVLASWQTVPVWLIVLNLAVAPAVAEELFFRGFLLSALRAVWRPAWAIGASAVLFGLFHLITTQMLAAERFATSTIMGLLLGWICHRSASVIPGILVHVSNNSLLLTAAYYRDALRERGWNWLDQSHLPTTWIAAAAVAVVVGIAIIARTSRIPIAGAEQQAV